MNKWTQRYLNMAKEVATWSKDPSTKVGAIAVGDKGQILSQGYNGFPRGVKDTPDRYEVREEKYKYIVHGEMNAIYNACHSGASLSGATLYVTGLPVCSECAKGIIQVGIKKVVMQFPKDISQTWRDSMVTSLKMFAEANVIVMTHEEE
jgi:dCMP deaminase